MREQVWNGATADIRNAADWSPAGAPRAGATAIVHAGSVEADGIVLNGFALDLAGRGASAPTLALSGATLGAAMRVGVAGAGAAMALAGTDRNAGTITVGRAATLAIQLAGPTAELVSTGTIEATPGSIISITGGQVVNDGMLFADGGTMRLDTQVTGTGTLTAAHAMLDIQQIVGRGEHVAIHGATLQLADPHDFLGTLAGWDASSTLDLPNTSLTAASVAGGVLTLRDGIFTEAQIHLTGSYSTADFHLAAAAGGGTLITTTHAG